MHLPPRTDFYSGKGFDRIVKFMEKAVKQAKKSTCPKSKRGVVIAKKELEKKGKIKIKTIGRGFNGPKKLKCGSACVKCDLYSTCIRHPEEVHRLNRDAGLEGCYGLHAEMRAILNCKTRKDLKGAILYHIKLDPKDDKILTSRSRACTLCAPHILEVGIAEVVLLHQSEDLERGHIKFTKYSVDEYFRMAFEEYGQRKLDHLTNQ